MERNVLQKNKEEKSGGHKKKGKLVRDELK